MLLGLNCPYEIYIESEFKINLFGSDVCFVAWAKFNLFGSDVYFVAWNTLHFFKERFSPSIFSII